MGGVQHDAVLIVIDVRRVLQEPFLAADAERDEPVVLPRRVVHAPGIALVLAAELAAWVTGLRRKARRCDRPGVLLRL